MERGNFTPTIRRAQHDNSFGFWNDIILKVLAHQYPAERVGDEVYILGICLPALRNTIANDGR